MPGFQPRRFTSGQGHQDVLGGVTVPIVTGMTFIFMGDVR
jgi:hypothetical protein